MQRRNDGEPAKEVEEGVADERVVAVTNGLLSRTE